jgi:hypothetical protein
MQITSNTTDDVLEMSVRGRLDNQWADHLTAAIDDAIRLGSHSILLNLAETNYILRRLRVVRRAIEAANNTKQDGTDQ